MKKKIGNRILAVVMLISLISTILTGALALFTMGSIKNSVASLPEDMQKQLVEQNKKEYIKNGEAEIDEALKAYGGAFDYILSDIKEKTRELAQIANKYYSNQEEYKDSGKVVYAPNINGEGYSAQVIYETDINPEDIQGSVNFSANVANDLIETSKSDENIISTFFSLEKGFTVFADNNPQGKFNSKGGVIQYNARETDWYKTVKSTMGGCYTGIGYDKWGENPFIMYGYPVTGGGFRGGVCIKYAITPALASLSFDNTTVIMYDANGNISYSTAPEGTVFAKGNTIPEEFNNLLGGEVGLNPINAIKFGNDEYRSACYKTAADNLTIACIKSLNDIYAVQTLKSDDIKEGTQNAAKNIYNIICYASIVLVLIILLVIIFAAKCSSSLTKSIVNPVKRITNGIECVSEGNFEYRITPEGENEIHALCDSFNNLGPHISQMMEDAKLEVYEYEKNNSEFNVSTRVQRDSNNIAFPESDNFEIFASVKPAKFICSDFFDAFKVDSNHIAFAMIDTNQGGIDATFTGKIIKELIKAHSIMGESPYEILTNVNAQICEMSNKKINASVFMGILEITSGKVVFVNAGFDTVFIKRGSKDIFEDVKSQANPRLMTKADNLYSQESLLLEKGDILYICSDGITGAANEKYEKYTLESLKTTITENQRKPMDHLLNFVHDDVRKFVKGAPQLDDISMMTLKIKE